MNAKKHINRSTYWKGALQFAKRNTDNIQVVSPYNPLIDTYFDNRVDRVSINKLAEKQKLKDDNRVEMTDESAVNNNNNVEEEMTDEECLQVEEEIKATFQNLVTNKHNETYEENLKALRKKNERRREQERRQKEKQMQNKTQSNNYIGNQGSCWNEYSIAGQQNSFNPVFMDNQSSFDSYSAMSNQRSLFEPYSAMNSQMNSIGLYSPMNSQMNSIGSFYTMNDQRSSFGSFSTMNSQSYSFNSFSINNQSYISNFNKSYQNNTFDYPSNITSDINYSNHIYTKDISRINELSDLIFRFFQYQNKL